jgi:DnaJ-class molecular chaperone
MNPAPVRGEQLEIVQTWYEYDRDSHHEVKRTRSFPAWVTFVRRRGSYQVKNKYGRCYDVNKDDFVYVYNTACTFLYARRTRPAPALVDCPTCGGHGFADTTGPEGVTVLDRCPDCLGTKFVYTRGKSHAG